MPPFLAAILNLPVVTKLIDLIPNAEKKAELQAQLQKELLDHQDEITKALSAVDVAQAAVNAEEAKSPSLFIAGWRPAVGWVCATACAWAFVLQPVSAFVLAAAGSKTELPTLPMQDLIALLTGMLGLTAARSFEKFQGVQANH